VRSDSLYRQNVQSGAGLLCKRELYAGCSLPLIEFRVCMGTLSRQLLMHIGLKAILDLMQ
jgi:hypothetical protein